MSAYGAITVTANAPVDLLPPTTWDLLPRPAGKPASPFRHLAIHHLRLDTARADPGLLEYTHHVFAAEIEEGRSYPQEEDYVGGVVVVERVRRRIVLTRAPPSRRISGRGT